MSEKPTKESLWNGMLASLSPSARRALSPQTEPTPAVEPDTDELPLSAAARALLGAVPAEPAAEPAGEDAAEEDDPEACFLVECGPDDPMPILRKMKDVEAAARYIGRLEESGREMYVRVFVGKYLKVTTGPGRFLYHPDGVSAYAVPDPKFGKRPLYRADLDAIKQEEQEDGYVGPPCFSRGVMFKKLDAQANKKKAAVEDEPPPKKEDDHPKKKGGDEDDAAPPAEK